MCYLPHLNLGCALLALGANPTALGLAWALSASAWVVLSVARQAFSRPDAE